MKPAKKMTKEELTATLGVIIDDAETYVNTELSPARAKATNYYLGQLFGNEETGRSKVVLTEVRDAVLGVMPSMLRAIFGAEHTVEFAPRNPEQVEFADQATQFIRWVFEEQNGGFLKTYGVLKDGFVRGLGIYKWGWDDTSATKNYAAKGVTQSQLENLLLDDDVKLTRANQTKDPVKPAPVLGPDGQPMGQQQPTEAEYDIEFTRKESDGNAWLEMVPPEELLFNREARDPDKGYMLMAHKMRKTTGELISLGISRKDIDEHGGDDDSQLTNPETTSRQAVQQGAPAKDPEAGDANDKHVYHESYVHIDYDGDDIAELRRICTLGTGHYVVSNEPCDDHPFSLFVPDPEPHVMLGTSLADLTMDIQLIKSAVLRAILDGLSASIFPRIAYEEGFVNVNDILNTDIGAPIRMQKAGAVQPIEIPFVGQHGLPILQFLDDVKEGRTGQVKGGGELDADALQSTEKAAAQQSMTTSMARAEMFLRIFAETAMKPMFRGLLKLYVEHKPKAAMLKLRGKWTDVDPSAWDPNMGVKVNVMLGTGLVEQKVATLEAFTAKQELIISQFGVQNPAVKFSQYVNTIRTAGKLRGFQNMDDFFSEVDPNWQPPQAPPAPDPKLLKVQADQQDAQAKNALAAQQMQMDAQMKQQEMQLKQAQLQQQVAQMKQDAILKQAEMQQKYTLAQHTAEQAAENLAVTQALGIKEMELKYSTPIDLKKFDASVEAARIRQELDNDNLQHAASLAADLKKEEMRAAVEHERSQVEMQARTAEANKPEPAPAPAPAPAAPPNIKVDNHIHLPERKGATVSKGKDGKTRIDPDKD